MARIRSLKPEFFTDPDLLELTPLERLLFAGLWGLADCQGRMEDRPRDLKIKILPGDVCDVDAMLNNLAKPKPGQRHGFICRYVVDGKRYLQIEHLADHQKFHRDEKSRGLPAPPEENPADHLPAPVQQEEIPASTLPAGIPSGQQEEIPPSTPVNCERLTVNGERCEETLSTSQSTAPLALVVEAPTPTAPKQKTHAADEVFEHWREKLRPKAKVDRKRLRCVKARLSEGYSVADLRKAVDGCAADPFSQGQNDRHQRYDDLELICRDAAHVEKFMALAGGDGTGPPGAMRRLKPDEDPYAMEAYT